LSNTRRNSTTTPKKKCGECKKEKSQAFFFKVDSPMFPDGMINICRDCVREQVDVEDMESVIGFLRQIDKPYIEKYWNEAVQSGKHPLGEYIRKINSLSQFKGKTFDDSDGMQGVGKTTELQLAQMSDTIATVDGEVIEYSDKMVDDWGIGYKKHEYLRMEKFYKDMEKTHEIKTPVHIHMLKQLSYLSVDVDRLRQAGDWQNFTKLSKTIEDMTKSAGFRPVDRQGIDEATGTRSFSQAFEEVEREGFRLPPPITFAYDDVDKIIVALGNYYHRLVGKQILTEVPEEMKEDLDSFYEVDLTPTEINDEEYENLDFSLDGEDSNG
jgi:hypothetical protein